MTRRTGPSSSTPNLVDSMSVLRLIAWLLVFETHVLIVGAPQLLDLKYPLRDKTWLLLTPAWAGVWIFFTLSGYLIGKAYAAGRYDLSLDGIKAFYFNRLIRIAPLYYFVVLVASVFTHPEVLRPKNWHVMVPVLTFTYNGQQPINVVGALWFVSTLMQLYLLTPLFFWVVRRVTRTKTSTVAALGVLVAVGLGIRLFPVWLWHSPNPVSVWYQWVYTPSWANLDLFFGGFLIAWLMRGRSRPAPAALRGAIMLALVALSVATSYVYDTGMNKGAPTTPSCSPI